MTRFPFLPKGIKKVATSQIEGYTVSAQTNFFFSILTKTNANSIICVKNKYAPLRLPRLCSAPLKRRLFLSYLISSRHSTTPLFLPSMPEHERKFIAVFITDRRIAFGLKVTLNTAVKWIPFWTRSPPWKKKIVCPWGRREKVNYFYLAGLQSPKGHSVEFSLQTRGGIRRRGV